MVENGREVTTAMPQLMRGLLRTEPFGPGEDPRRAPGSYCGPQAARPMTPRRFLQNQGLTYVFGLLFMAFAIQNVGDGDPGPGELTFRWAVLGALALVYLGAAWAADLGLRLRYGYLLLFLALSLGTVPFFGWDFTNFAVYQSILIATLIPWRTSRMLLMAWNVAVLLTAIPERSLTPLVMAAMGLLIGWAVGGGIEAGRIRHHLDAAEKRVSTLAVAAERERIARDLHDILGHSLTAISIKSGLAARLSEQDPTAARLQMNEVEQIARVALADVRATTTGMREVRLATEIASARSVLMAAGVEAVTPTAMHPLSDEDSELLGYVVREAVTNVVRHAEASRCVIEVGDDSVVISDDGSGMPRGPRSGSGLAGLRRRIADAGGVLVVRPAASGGTVVRATLHSSEAQRDEQHQQAAARRQDEQPAREQNPSVIIPGAAR